MRAYGASGGGRTIDSDAINRAIDAAEPGPGNAYQDFGHSHWHNSLIRGDGVEDVSITGPGRIDGRGLLKGLEGSATGQITDLDRAVPNAANKAIALRLARNVGLRDVRDVHVTTRARPLPDTQVTRAARRSF